MNYIIIDMEWNQPSKKEDTVTEPVPLYGEIIRIGAVKLDSGLDEKDRFHCCVLPKYYRRMNSAVGRVTGLRSVSMTYGQRFPDAYDAFLKWCGEDFAVLSWGSEDDKIMNANLAVHGIDRGRLPEFFDLQQIFAHKIAGNGRQYGIAAALEYYGLPADLKAHDALNDAVYAARIGRKMGFDKYLEGYEEMLRAAEEKKKEKYFFTYHRIESPEAAMSSRRITLCRCPLCRRIMKRGEYACVNDTLYVTRASCGRHGEFFVRLRLTLCPDKTYSVTRTIKRPSPEYIELYEKSLEKLIKM